MASKTINQIITTVLPADAQYTIDIADNHDTGNNHPGCAFASVKLRDGEIQHVWLQHVTRGDVDPDTGRAPVTGKVVAVNGPLSGAELTSLRSILLKVFNKAASDAGYA